MNFHIYPEQDGRAVLASIDPHRAIAELEDPGRGIALKRNTAMDLVTALIDFLDDTEGDCDLEDNGDLAPSLCGWELHGEVDLEGDDADDEPSLGAIETQTNASFSSGFVRPHTRLVDCVEPVTSQASWATNGANDLEQNITDEPHDGDLDVREGDNSDDEYSLGWTTAHEDLSQGYGALAAGHAAGDNEADDADREPSLGAPELGPTAWYRSTAGNHLVDGSQAHLADGRGDMEEEFCNEDGDDADYAA